MLFFVREVLEVFRQLLEFLGFPVRFGVIEYLLAVVTHPFQASTGGIDAGCKSALQHRHGEAQRTTTGSVVLLGLHGLLFNIVRQRVVEVRFIVVQFELDCLYIAVREETFYDARFRIGELDECFLRTAEVEWSIVPLHGLFEALHTAVYVPV